MAEGLAKSMFGRGHNIQSAGSKPSGEVHPNAVSAMDDIGVDIRDQYSKYTDDLDKVFAEFILKENFNLEFSSINEEEKKKILRLSKT